MIGKKFCPNCGSEDVQAVAGGIGGAWICKDCGYAGSVFPEKTIIGRESENKDVGDEEECEYMNEGVFEDNDVKEQIMVKSSSKVKALTKKKSKRGKSGRNKK